MSFIISGNTALIYAKLTKTGRQLLAQGALTYDYWVAGDSEIDYGFYSPTYDLENDKVLRPKDNNTNIKYPVPSVLGGSIFNSLPPIVANANLITNVAPTRGFVDSNNVVIPSLLIGQGTGTTTNLTGGTTLLIGLDWGGVATGDTVMIQLKSNFITGATSGITTNLPIPYLFYMVEATTNSSGTTVITVDRTLPNFGSGGIAFDVYILPGGDAINNFYGSATTIPYWNEDTLAFTNNSNVSNDNVPVWNLSIVYTENIAGVNTATYTGINGYETITYTGFKEFINDTSQSPRQKSIAIIHYSNNSISNYYGESLVSGTFTLSLPTVLWHKIVPSGGSGTGTQMGVTLSSQTNPIPLTINPTPLGTTAIPFNSTFDILVDNFGNIVGKVFLDLKVAVIEDEELVAAMSYKSNRNWSLPTLNGNWVSSVSDSTGLIGSNQQAYVTYLLANETTSGYTTGLHCMNYIQINRGGTAQNNINVSFPVNQLPYMKTSINSGGGFSANKLFLLVQVVPVGTAPSPTGWKSIDVTSSINGYVAGYINPLNLENSSFTLNLANYTSGTTYNLDTFITIPSLAQTNYLNFGDESFLFGDINTQISATAFEAPFVFTMPSSQFITSVNPTYNSVVNDSIYFSEVGVYNTLNQLVAIGKISLPIKKKSSDTIQLQLDIDF